MKRSTQKKKDFSFSMIRNQPQGAGWKSSQFSRTPPEIWSCERIYLPTTTRARGEISPGSDPRLLPRPVERILEWPPAGTEGGGRAPWRPGGKGGDGDGDGERKGKTKRGRFARAADTRGIPDIFRTGENLPWCFSQFCHYFSF